MLCKKLKTSSTFRYLPHSELYPKIETFIIGHFTFDIFKLINSVIIYMHMYYMRLIIIFRAMKKKSRDSSVFFSFALDILDVRDAKSALIFLMTQFGECFSSHQHDLRVSRQSESSVRGGSFHLAYEVPESESAPYFAEVCPGLHAPI